MKEIIDKKNEYENVLKNIDEANLIIKNESDKEMLELANSEMVVYKENLVELEEQLKILLIPKDPDDAKNIVMELRAGTGEMRQVSLQVIYLECTQSMLKNRVGKLILLILMKELQAATKR